MKTLNKLIDEYKQGDKDAFESIVHLFKPTLNKYKRNSYYEDMDRDLEVFILTILEKMKIKDEYKGDDKYTFSYISKALKNKFIRVNQKHYEKYKYEYAAHEEVEYAGEYSINSNIIFMDIIKDLSLKEQDILTKHYIGNLGESDIAREYKTSRQYINKVHKKALIKLRESQGERLLS